jgi:hypothetical protein
MRIDNQKRLYFSEPNVGRVIPTGIAIASARVDKA